MTHSADYASELFEYLAVQQDETISVPVFCNEEEVKDWAGLDLSLRQVSIRQLLASIPQGWWVTFRPGSDTGKEFSPWELEELSKGPEAIESILDEIFSDSEIEPLQYREPESGEYQELKAALIDFSKKHQGILTLSLLKHEESELLQIGAGLEKSANKSVIKDGLSSLCQQLLVGDIHPRIFLYENDHPGAIGLLFQKTQPFYKRSSRSLFDRLCNLLGR